MKKTFKFLGLTLAVFFVFIFVACKDDPPKDNSCKCPKGTVHYDEPCDCGGENCSDNCTVKHSVETTSFGVPVYAGEGVTSSQAIAFVTTINSGYNGLSETNKDTIKNKVKKINVVAGGADNCSYANGIVNFGQDCSIVDVNSFLGGFVVTAKVIDNSKETVRMAFAVVNSKGNAKSI
jgi:hypothetical protein